MYKWSKKIDGEQISLSDDLINVFDDQRERIICWTNKQRENNNDSLKWWMSHLAGRNNMASKFYLSLLQILALKRWLNRNNNHHAKLLIICEDIFIINALHNNIDKNLSKTKIIWLIGYIFDYSYYIIRAIFISIKQIYWYIKNAIVAKTTKKNKIKQPTGELYIIHQCLNDAALKRGNPLRCNYFRELPDWIENNGKKVYRLPWLYDVKIPLKQVYSLLRESRCVIPQDWVNISDYIWALKNSLTSFMAINYNVPYKGLNIRALLLRERLKQIGDSVSLSVFWLYKPTLIRFLKSVNKVIIISEYENMPPEHVQAHTLHQLYKIDSKIIGYYHSIVTKDFLGYHIPINEVESSATPDLVISNSFIGKDILIEQGLPKSYISVGPALRQNISADETISKKNKKAILLPLSLTNASIELMYSVEKINSFILSELKVPVFVKPHPVDRKERILKNMNWKKLPDGWIWKDGDIKDILKECFLSINISSASVIDVILAGTVPCPMRRELDLSWNFVDFLEKKYEIFKPIEYGKLTDKLHDVFIYRPSYYSIQIEHARKYLINGLGNVTDINMGKFIS